MTNHVARIDWAWLLGAVPQDLSGLAKANRSGGSLAQSLQRRSAVVAVHAVRNRSAFTSVHVLSEPEHGSVQAKRQSLLHRLRAAARFCRPCSITCFLSLGRSRQSPRTAQGSCGLQERNVLCVPAAAGPTSDCIPSTCPGPGFDECRNHRWQRRRKAAQGALRAARHRRGRPGAGTRAQYPPRASTGAFTLVRAYLQNIRLHDGEGKRLDPLFCSTPIVGSAGWA